MQKAAFKFIGEHDFRNFCKMDAANVSNYKRHITDFNISACDQRLNCISLKLSLLSSYKHVMHVIPELNNGSALYFQGPTMMSCGP